MAKSAYLVLENGRTFEGQYFGAEGEITGEIVFTTGMTGYLETLSDPSYCGQIILQTFPLIGNYGIIPEDFESDSIEARAYIVKEACEKPSNFRCEGSLGDYFKEKGVIGLCGIDTRALTRITRENGVMNGKIMSHPPTDSDIAEVKAYTITNPIMQVSPKEITKVASGGDRRIAMLNFGAKRGIVKELERRGCDVWSFPHDASVEEIMKIDPHAIMLSNGPGNPAAAGNQVIIDTLKALIKTDLTIFGICMGHQLLAVAHGYETKKLKFGHRGANQPVKDMETGRVYMTSQNHGYEVVSNGKSAFVNNNDGTCEGLDYGKSFSVQFHPEACAGPLDTGFLFDKFMERI